MKTIRILLSVTLCLAVLAAGGGSAFAVEYHFLQPFLITVYVGDTASGVRAYHVGYPNNIYLSLGDLAYALDGSEKQYSIVYGSSTQDGEYHAVRTGQPASSGGAGISQTPLAERTDVWLAIERNRIFVDGADRKYYTIREGGHDLYMSLIDLQLMLDFTIEKTGDDSIRIFPDMPFEPDYLSLESEGYFAYINSFVLGDADTGVLLCALNHGDKVSIASISKLMTYLLFKEAEQRGEVSASASVTISPAVEAVSKAGDGLIPMEAGQSVPVSELLDAMLVASSNEAASAIAEYVAGSQEKFVEKMNLRANELGLTSAEFFTPNGLPIYSDSSIPGKLQNRMNAYDLFLLCSYIMRNFPEITEITSKAYASMPTLEYTTANSNPLLFNMPGVNGLKTGSTNRAGYCLAASVPVTSGDETHRIILCLLGAEDASERGQAAEILLRFAVRYYEQNGFPVP